MTDRQKSLKNGITADRLVAEWGAESQSYNLSLKQIAAHKDIPTLADINVVYGNIISSSLISEHIRTILRYVGIDVSPSAMLSNTILAMQIADTSNIIASNYYYLNLMEIALFFREIKSGKRGQVIWGNKLNTQELMVRLSDFVSDRALAIERNELESKKEQEKKGFSNIKQAGAAITEGLYGWRKMLEEAKSNYDKFLSMFPKFPDILSPVGWYNAWLGERESLEKIFGSEIPNNYHDEIIKTLCDYNVANQ